LLFRSFKMGLRKSAKENEVETIGLIREKTDAVYAVTFIFAPGCGPVLVWDSEGNPQLQGGKYDIKKATWDRYRLDGRGAYVTPDRPLSAWGEGPVNGCKVTYVSGEPVFMWDREEDFAVTGRGVRMHVRKLDRAAYRFREALQILQDEHPGITLRRAHDRVDPIIRDEIPKKSRPPYKPTGRPRGAPIKSEFTLEIRRLKQTGESCREAQRKMFAWHRKRFTVSDPESRSRESVNRSVRRIYAEKR
jgi:hypothetical protein